MQLVNKLKKEAIMKNSGYNVLEQGLIIGSVTTRMEEIGELKPQDFDVNYYTIAKQIIGEYENSKSMEYFSVFVERRLKDIQKSKDEQRQEDSQYKLLNVEVNEKGYLKGYITGMIEFNNQGRLHDFLYRINDVDNGESNKLVSIDYGYRNPLVGELWSDIETYINKNYCNA